MPTLPIRNLGSPRRIVVKIGSAVIASQGVLEPGSVQRLAADASSILENKKRSLVLVSSGAVASGYRALGLAKPPKEIVGKQAAAAVGQPRLMSAWADSFAPTPVAQVLLTAEDIDHRTRFLNARRTLESLLNSGVVPIINENDSVSYAEIKLGDNDHLSSLVASLVSADLLIILSSVSGVWSREPRAQARDDAASKSSSYSSSKSSSSSPAPPTIIPEIRSLPEGLKLVRSDKTGVGTGGMETKIKAACSAASLGINVIIASGSESNILQRLLAGEPLGTFFPAATSSSRAARKRWIGFSARPKGTLRVDDGARKAITSRGASLLPSGLTAVHGDFASGALVEIAAPDGTPFARGLSSYDSVELTRIKGRKTSDIAAILGYCYTEEAVHRDDLVILDSTT